jgi:succinate dehydrogenase/fumarate reductase-like Fe-S protein
MSAHTNQTNSTQGATPDKSYTPAPERQEAQRFVEIRIKRRDRPDAPQRWEEFRVPYRPNLNIISCLMVKAWIEIDGTHDLGPGPKMTQDEVAERYAYSRCMTCGCCLEACPQYDEDQYIGPQAIAQVRYQNMHPSGKMTRDERLEGIMGDDGITNCGNAQNCVRVCPMSIPLTKAIYEENRETILHGLFGWLKR